MKSEEYPSEVLQESEKIQDSILKEEMGAVDNFSLERVKHAYDALKIEEEQNRKNLKKVFSGKKEEITEGSQPLHFELLSPTREISFYNLELDLNNPETSEAISIIERTLGKGHAEVIKLKILSIHKKIDDVVKKYQLKINGLEEKLGSAMKSTFIDEDISREYDSYIKYPIISPALFKEEVADYLGVDPKEIETEMGNREVELERELDYLYASRERDIQDIISKVRGFSIKFIDEGEMLYGFGDSVMYDNEGEEIYREHFGLIAASDDVECTGYMTKLEKQEDVWGNGNRQKYQTKYNGLSLKPGSFVCIGESGGRKILVLRNG